MLLICIFRICGWKTPKLAGNCPKTPYSYFIMKNYLHSIACIHLFPTFIEGWKLSWRLIWKREMQNHRHFQLQKKLRLSASDSMKIVESRFCVHLSLMRGANHHIRLTKSHSQRKCWAFAWNWAIASSKCISEIVKDWALRRLHFAFTAVNNPPVNIVDTEAQRGTAGAYYTEQHRSECISTWCWRRVL